MDEDTAIIRRFQEINGIGGPIQRAARNHGIQGAARRRMPIDDEKVDLFNFRISGLTEKLFSPTNFPAFHRPKLFGEGAFHQSRPTSASIK